METILAVIVTVTILGGAVFYICRAKKKGQKCIGCPYGGNCTQCHGHDDEEKSET